MKARANLNESGSEVESKVTPEPEVAEAPKSPYKLGGDPPDEETKLEDVVEDLPENVMSRTGTPSTWTFDDREVALKTAPPRPASATMCSPPVPRKVPISVDHHLRK